MFQTEAMRRMESATAQLDALASVETAAISGLRRVERIGANVTAGQNINQAAGTLTVDTTMAFTGAPVVVEISVNLHGAIGNVNSQRNAPVVELWRTNGTPTLLATMATGYIRDTSDHEEASWHCHYTDDTPGTDPAYELRTRRDTTISGTVAVQAPSTLQAKAEF